MKRIAKAVVVGGISVAAVVGCSGGKSETATTTKTVTATATATASPTLTKGVLVNGSEEQNFVSSVTVFSGYWAMKDANDLVALGRTACVTMGTSIQSGLDFKQAQKVAAVKVQQSLLPNPPSSDEANSFANSALNFLCDNLLDLGR